MKNEKPGQEINYKPANHFKKPTIWAVTNKYISDI